MRAGRLAALALLILSATAAATTPVLAKAKAGHKASHDYYRENNQANKTLSVAPPNKDEGGIQSKW